MMWTLIVIGLAFVIWRFMQPEGGEAEAAAEAPTPPPPPEAPPSGGESGDDDPFKAPGS